MFACLLFLCYVYVSIFGEKLYRAYMFCICKNIPNQNKAVVFRILYLNNITGVCIIFSSYVKIVNVVFVLRLSSFDNIYILENTEGTNKNGQIQRNWQHRVHKKKKYKAKTQHNMS
jgi:hypothetical protein